MKKQTDKLSGKWQSPSNRNTESNSRPYFLNHVLPPSPNLLSVVCKYVKYKAWLLILVRVRGQLACWVHQLFPLPLCSSRPAQLKWSVPFKGHFLLSFSKRAIVSIWIRSLEKEVKHKWSLLSMKIQCCFLRVWICHFSDKHFCLKPQLLLHTR